MGQITMSAQQFAANWKTGLTGSVQKIKDGISRVQESPMAKAAQNVEGYVAGVTRAAQSGRWANALNAVPLQDWKNITSQKVGERLAGGASAAESKMAKFGTWLIPKVNDAVASIQSMPKLTLDDNINRVSAYLRKMAENPYKG